MDVIQVKTTNVKNVQLVFAVTIRCPTPRDADVWFQSIHSCVDSLLTQANAELNLMLGGNPEVRNTLSTFTPFSPIFKRCL